MTSATDNTNAQPVTDETEAAMNELDRYFAACQLASASSNLRLLQACERATRRPWVTAADQARLRDARKWWGQR